MTRTVEVVRTYLELRSPGQLRPAPLRGSEAEFVEYSQIGVTHYRRLYRLVGAQWHWNDRDAWTDERLAAHLAAPTIRVTECLVDGESAGFFELERHDDGSTEIAYFGLATPFHGRGLGKAMLTRAAHDASRGEPARVWLHTCTLDSPMALPNYLARGFTKVKEETFIVELPDFD